MTPIFTVEERRARPPWGGAAVPLYVIHAADWVNVIPLLPDGRVLLIRQYRHGIEAPALEIPGGVVDAADAGPAAAAMRELREETGHAAGRLIPLGSVSPNPAIQSNRCHTFLAAGVTPAGEQALDAGESIGVEAHPLAEVPQLIAGGEMGHALVVAAFGLLGARLPGGLVGGSVEELLARVAAGEGER